jgi:tetraacyldisaccharide 4'-kinase
MLPTTGALRAALGRRLEQGAPSGIALLAASAWGAWSARSVARPLPLPPGVRVIGVGGAVLGGAGKTPVAIAIARTLAEQGVPTALAGHGYRARPGGPRVVRPDDAVAVVGDDALVAARMLDGVASVVVAPGRRAALEHAAGLGHRAIVADGLLQTAPVRLFASILVLDALAPWGSGACPPAGDLRAPPGALLAAADLIAAVTPEGEAPDPSLPPGAILVPSRVVEAVSPAGETIPFPALAGLRLGLVLAIGRPGRVVAALGRAGIRPEVTIRLGDHAVPAGAVLAGMARANVEAWLTTARCAPKLPAAIGRAPVLRLDHRVDVAVLVDRIALHRAAGLGKDPPAVLA